MFLKSLQQSSKAFWQEQWTALWGWSKITAGGILASLSLAGQVVADPYVRGAIDNLHLPAWVGLGIAAFGVVTLLSMAHKDTPCSPSLVSSQS
jgi:hypothetical protein